MSEVEDLHKYLLVKCGQPWVKVKKDPPENLLERLVYTNLIMFDGYLAFKNGRKFEVYSGQKNFYVDPEDGLLKEVKPFHRVSWWKDDQIKIEEAKKGEYPKLLRKKDGVWYEV